MSRRTAFVTGASHGIGAAIAVELAAAGYDLAIAATRIENLSAVLPKLETAGARVVPVAFDLRSNDSIERAMHDVTQALGALDVLVNNAGTTLREAADKVTVEQWDAVIRSNLTGTFFMSQKMGQHLVGRGRAGCIISIASTHGLVGFPQRLVYGVAKAGIVHMTKMLAVEWAEYGIRVNAVAPGTVETPSRAAFFSSVAGAREKMTERVPLRRFGEPREVAGAVRYLASPEAAYITGQTLVVDGGLTAY